MKLSCLVLLLIGCHLSFAQSGYLNRDGTMSNKYKRELMLASIKEYETPDNRYDIENLSFVVIVKSDLDSADSNKDELQKDVMISSFLQLLNRINVMKNVGYDTFQDAGFESITFKINTIVDYSTRRYHFKFSLAELVNLPNYMDIKELVNYVGSRNNRNIIYGHYPINCVS